MNQSNPTGAESTPRTSNPLFPPPTVLVKLGSLAVHADEYLGEAGHDFDRVAIQGILADAEVIEWTRQMTALGPMPVKR